MLDANSVGHSWGSLPFLSCSWLDKGNDELLVLVIVIPRKERRIAGPHRQHPGQQFRQVLHQVERFELVLFDPLERAFRRRPGIAPSARAVNTNTMKWTYAKVATAIHRSSANARR